MRLTCVPDVLHRAAYGQLSYATVHRLLNHPTASVNLEIVESSEYRIPNSMRSELLLPCNKFLYNFCILFNPRDLELLRRESIRRIRISRRHCRRGVDGSTFSPSVTLHVIIYSIIATSQLLHPT